MLLLLFATAGEVVDPPAPAPAEKTRGPGGVKPRRKYFRVFDGERWVEVFSRAAVDAVVAKAQARAVVASRATAQRMAVTEAVEPVAARVEAPVVRVEADDGEELAALQRNVAAINAQIQQMYENALRAELIGMALRAELDDEDASALLL